MTTLRTAATGFNTLLHVTDPFAIIRALGADLRAFTTNVAMMFRAYQHEMRGRPAYLAAGHHQLEVRRTGVLSSGLETMSHRRGQAFAVAGEAVFDAALHFG
ncbi:hypothetical protein A9Z06_01555 [Rhizobium sp. YK2]|nr:hypothetical protein A9Z06_01555 [Rhizobium sp. YK2]